jgi:hypothetical protein
MRSLILIFVVMICGCDPLNDPEMDPEMMDAGRMDAGMDGSIDTPCGRMCGHFRTLGCDEALPFYDSDKPGPVDEPNTTCEEFCESQMDLGVDLNTECSLKAPTCNDIEAWRAMTCN